MAGAIVIVQCHIFALGRSLWTVVNFLQCNTNHNATKVGDMILNYFIPARFDILNYFDILSLFNCVMEE